MKEDIIEKVLSTVQYHHMLTECINNSQTLHSVSRFSPIDWIMTNVCDYTRTLLDSVNDPSKNKQINRVTITNINDLESHLQSLLFEESKISEHFRYYLVDDEITKRVNKYNKYFSRHVKVILGETLLIFSLIHSNKKDSILIDNKNSENFFGDFLNDCDEVLIFDDRVLKVKMKNSNEYIIKSVIKEKKSVTNYLNDWKSRKEQCIADNKAITLEDLINKYKFEISNFDIYHPRYRKYILNEDYTIEKARES